MGITSNKGRIKCHLAGGTVYLDSGCYQRQLGDKFGKLVLVSMVLNKQHEYFTNNILPMDKALKGRKDERSRTMRRNIRFWGEAYHQLNMNWFNCWNDEIKGLMCDSMDDFEDKTRNGVVRCRIAYRNLLRPIVPADLLTTVVNLILCSEFVAVAAKKYEDVYRCPEQPIIINRDFGKLLNSIIHFSQAFYPLPNEIYIDSDAFARVGEEEHLLGERLMEWMQDPNSAFFKNFCKEVK